MGRIPEHPFQLRRPRERCVHAFLQGVRGCGRRLVGRRDGGAHRGVEVFPRVGVDPGLIGIVGRRAAMDVASYFGVDPEAGQQRPEQHLVRLGMRGGEEIRHVVVTGGRKRRGAERLRRDAVLPKERAMQRALDHDRALRRLGELYDPVGVGRLGRGQRQRTPEADQVVRILGDVVLEPRLIQRAGRELGIERHAAYDLIDIGVPFPCRARECVGAHACPS